MSICKAGVYDAKAIQALILRSVDPETNTDFDQEGILHFHTHNKLSSIRDRILSEEYLTLCYGQNGKIVGIITMQNNQTLSQLFVDPAARGLKLSRQLWQAAQKICSVNGNKGNYRVKSSTVAVPVYKSFGFRMDGELQKKNGIVFSPMVLACEN